jgi:hypothetical protein
VHALLRFCFLLFVSVSTRATSFISQIIFFPSVCFAEYVDMVTMRTATALPATVALFDALTRL